MGQLVAASNNCGMQPIFRPGICTPKIGNVRIEQIHLNQSRISRLCANDPTSLIHERTRIVDDLPVGIFGAVRAPVQDQAPPLCILQQI